MYNFIFQNTTKLIFGKGTISSLSAEIPVDKKILLTFGGGSIKSNGVYDQVKEALSKHNCVEFWGIEPNPSVETLRKAVELGKKESVNFILAVGGGSVIDGSKLIAAAILNENDPWDIVRKGVDFSKMLPFASVLTLPATGSEMNRGSVISNLTKKEKFAFYSNYPEFSILDPQTTFSLPDYQVACGIADTFVHVMEQYLTTPGQSPLMDRWAEGILLTLKEIAPKITKEHTDYEAMATFMLSATMALNGFISMGVSQDWATHMIGHELTALTGITHGHSLSIVLPGTMDIRREEKGSKILQYGERVWNITGTDKNSTIDKIIDATEEFFRSLGLKTKLSENNIGQEVINEITERFKSRKVAFGENGTNDYLVTEKILNRCK
jgi:NADP-dependent alcohol dehydrogenase